MLATPVKSALAQLQEWNLITFGNYTAGNEVEGRVFVGGDYNGVSSEQFNFKGATSKNGTGAITVVGNASGDKVDTTNGDFVVGGNVSIGTIEGHGNNAYVGGTVSAQNNHADSTTSGLAKSNPDFTSTLNNQKASLIDSMTSLSANLKALTDTDTLDYKTGNAVTFTAKSGVNVLSTTIDQINQFATNYIDINSPDGTTTIINVSGSGTIDKNFNYNGSSKNIIWNFYDATSLTLGNWQGSVLATGADFIKDQQGNLQGTVVAKSAANYAELHSYGFQGDLSSVGSSTTALPEPGTWAMLILGFGAIGYALRRRAPGLAVAARI